jgi:hypothetical protein
MLAQILKSLSKTLQSLMIPAAGILLVLACSLPGYYLGWLLLDTPVAPRFERYGSMMYESVGMFLMAIIMFPLEGIFKLVLSLMVLPFKLIGLLF